MFVQYAKSKRLIVWFALIAPLMFSGYSHAQSVDSCMSAKLNDALSVCQNIINNGSRNIDVYWKLSSAQYQDGQQALANKTLSEAIRLYPGNAKLETLKEIISTDSTEQKLIAESAKRNQASVDQGALKIACLTKAGKVGISACERRLELTNLDGQRIAARLALLKESQTPEQIAVAPTRPDPVVQEPDPTPSTPVAVFVPSPTTQPTQPSAQEQDAFARQAAYKELVAGVQQSLNGFGFNAGRPDGVPGSNTRKALASFYQAINAPVVTSITDNTLLDLQQAGRNKAQAQRLLVESQRALSEGNAQLARNKLGAARRTSALLSEPSNLERTILAALNISAPIQTPLPTQAAIQTPAQTPVNLANAAPQFDTLMGQINALQGQIKRQQSTQAIQLNQLRNAL